MSPENWQKIGNLASSLAWHLGVKSDSKTPVLTVLGTPEWARSERGPGTRRWIDATRPTWARGPDRDRPPSGRICTLGRGPGCCFCHRRRSITPRHPARLVDLVPAGSQHWRREVGQPSSSPPSKKVVAAPAARGAESTVTRAVHAWRAVYSGVIRKDDQRTSGFYYYYYFVPAVLGLIDRQLFLSLMRLYRALRG